ncbi:hypothetical protein QIU19_10155 [Capnocytophaga canimorsus]|nr:hypothetical protein [Capnocytophaga canimorsus]WGU67802.1 hypothetical protein QIU19_10155 [Capnocytophaga canimorsus]
MLINCAVTTKKSEREKTHLAYAEYVATKDSSLTKADGMEYYRYYSDFIKYELEQEHQALLKNPYVKLNEVYVSYGTIAQMYELLAVLDRICFG